MRKPDSRGGFAYVDESGDPGLNPTHLQKRPCFVFGHACVKDRTGLDRRLKRLLKRLRRRDKHPPKLMELKFCIPYGRLAKHGYSKEQYSAYDANMPDVGERALEILASHTDGVFAAVVDKRGARSTWTPKRLGNCTFAQTLVLGVMREIGSGGRPTVIYDKGRLSQSSERSFESYLRHKQIDFADKHGMPHLLEPCPACSASSIHHPGIWAADYAAGAFCHKRQTGDARYADIPRPVWPGKGEWAYWNRRTHGNPNRT